MCSTNRIFALSSFATFAAFAACAALSACVPSSTPHARTIKDAGAGDAEPAPDATAPPVVQLCDPVKQTGCNPDEACVWSVEDDSAHCQTPTTNASLGDPCNTDEPSCSGGFTCTALRNDENTTCYAVCDPNTNTGCEMHATANRNFVCLPMANLSFGLCVLVGSTCDPLTPNTCDDNETCTLFGGQTSCVPAGEVAKGEDCSSSACHPGLLCIKLSDRLTPVCLQPCDTGSPTCPGGQEVCTGLEGLNLGVCQNTRADCSPLQDRCPSGQACGIRGTDVVCLSPGSSAMGAECSQDPCGKGAVCARMRGEPAPLCREPCDLGLPRCTSPTQECTDIGLGGFGICR